MTTDFDRKIRIRQRFGRATGTYDRHARAQKQIQRRLAGLLSATGRTCFDRILEVGCGTGGLTRELLGVCRGAEWTVNDLLETVPAPLPDILAGERWRYLPGDAETIGFPGRFDLVASGSAVQWFADPAAFVRKAADTLLPGGLLLLNTFGPENLKEIKTLTGEGLDYPALADVAVWLPSGFRLKTLTVETIRLDFPDPAAVLRHLKATGVTASGSGRWTRGRLERFCRDYAARYAVESGVAVTYQPVYLLAEKAGGD